MRLVRFTEAPNGETVWVNPDRVATVAPDGSGRTYITMARAAGLLVREPELEVVQQLITED